MTDIVEWLRNAPPNEWNGLMMDKAADEIERLRKALGRIALVDSQGIALAALGQIGKNK